MILENPKGNQTRMKSSVTSLLTTATGP